MTVQNNTMAPRSGYRPVRGNSPTPTNTGRDTTNWTNTTNRWHWAAHAGSAVALVSLLVLLLSSNERCWDRYNYYCNPPPPWISDGCEG